jgi:ABC-2 type transport system permease protein
MNQALFRYSWRAQRVKLVLVCVALAVWGFLLPVIYAEFGSQFQALMRSGLVPQQFLRFGNGDIFSLSGAIALGFIHPIAIILTSVFAVGFSTTAVAGERQRGTLEVVLARPLSRRRLYATLLVACLTFVGTTVAALLAGSIAGSLFAGVAGELTLARVPALWLNGVLLFGSFAAIGLAASVSFDRLTPALGVTLGILIVMYVFDVVGSLWPDAQFLQPYSLFHYLKPKAILTAGVDRADLLLLSAVIAAAVAWAVVVFPRRDIAAPS